jgi:hypothetical protein
MSYVPALDQIQLGTEGTWGSTATATGKLGLIADCVLEPEVEVETLKDVRGSLAPGFVAVLNKHQGAASISGVPSYDDLPYILNSLFNTSSAGAATTYTRDYVGQTTTAPTRTKYTLYRGSAGKVQKMLGTVFNELQIKVESNKPWQFSAKAVGHSVLDGSLAALADRSQTPIHANVTTMYLDAVGGTMGATPIASIWFSAELSIKNGVGLVPKVGSLTPTAYVDGMAEATLKIKCDVDATSAGYLTSVLGTSLLQKQIRIKATTGATQIAQFDFAGTFSSSPKINTDQDGVSTFEFELDALYNTTLGNWMKASVTNSIAAMA